jgi:diphosphomevalonate decarboxylase
MCFSSKYFLARLGSGSACRSIEGDLIVWGKHKEITGSSDFIYVKYPFEVHDNFKKLSGHYSSS